MAQILAIEYLQETWANGHETRDSL